MYCKVNKLEKKILFYYHLRGKLNLYYTPGGVSEGKYVQYNRDSVYLPIFLFINEDYANDGHLVKFKTLLHDRHIL